MKRYLSIILILCSFCFSHVATGAEWKVERGDSLWTILEEVCQVKPSMKKVRVFARAVGIQTPSLIVIGERIDVSRGCAALSDAPSASLEKVLVLSAQQGETLRAMQRKIASLETESAKLRLDLEVSHWKDAPYQTTVSSVEPGRQAGIAQTLSSNMEAFVSQGTGAKGYHAYGDPVFFFKGWMVLVAVFCLFVGFSFLRKRRGDGMAVYHDSTGGEALALPIAPSSRVSLRSMRSTPVGSRTLDFSEDRAVDIPL